MSYRMWVQVIAEIRVESSIVVVTILVDTIGLSFGTGRGKLFTIVLGNSLDIQIGLPALTSAVLCPRLTPPSSTRRLPVVPLPVAGVHGMEVSPDKNANSNCTTLPFTVRPESWASTCGAALPGRSALYGVSVRGLTVLRSGFLQTVGRPSALAFG